MTGTTTNPAGTMTTDTTTTETTTAMTANPEPIPSSSSSSTSPAETIIDTSTHHDHDPDPESKPEESHVVKTHSGEHAGEGERVEVDVNVKEKEEWQPRTMDFGLVPIPRRLRHDPSKPFHFGIVMNVAFGFASTFTVANLYYCQPLLIQLAESFDVSYSQVSNIPTLVQAGYAVGLLFICPLGDLVRRRPLILALVTGSTTLSIGLAITPSLPAFSALTFLVGALSITPMVLLPLAADLAPPHRRASAISVVLSGLLFGILSARVLAGVVAQFVSWRVVYYLAIGVQAVILAGCYWVIPDYPRVDVGEGVGYGGILWSMGRFAVREPLVVQAALVNIASSACFTNFWVTLTFLLAGPPYHYSTLVIGLFGLVGMLGVALGPLVGRMVDHLDPWHSSLISIVLLTAFQTVQVGAGGISVGAVIVTAFALDVLRAMLQVSLTTAVFSIDPSARARLNAILVLSIFVGQVLGTAVGTLVFIKHGWRASALLSLGWYGWQIGVWMCRGPRWRWR
ncbi:major facilitator superfamily domain-containing protein [Collybia nuda]|uniref:Major facilitator superfamily domain-containing protein n=1 Tax=Collybia nuda TaxID=64659 RepID=A0A9P6CED5_9AGAR|nr:major facilitator superfamily domain-containing protein [Collybia nuda]